MHKKNIVFIAKSLDGYIADKNGETEWLHAVPNPENDDMGFNRIMEEADAVVMGRTTYETVLNFGGDWPYSKQVFVLSHSLKSVPQNLSEKVTLLKGTPQEVLTKIHNRGFYTLYIDGGRTVQDFLRADLIDELRITTIPVLLGGGFPLFGDLAKPLKFAHIESALYLNELVQNHYRRKR